MTYEIRGADAAGGQVTRSRRAPEARTHPWTEGGYIANHRLPEKAEPSGTKPEYAPGVIVRAHGHDFVEHAYDPAREQMVPPIGQMRWLIDDGKAYRSMTTAWRQAKDIGEIVLPYRDRRLFNSPVPEPTGVRGGCHDPGQPGEPETTPSPPILGECRVCCGSR